ncbi:hypothetical protein [Insolitispirillum peregrinum]|uniref:Uncharacterized protein n=1 Tax=Insolitispirillum peregrinum TaxID=80876 RepID=A0A1N7KGE3_9PROT|nr:hypothetical protein [Insolitispirillum peregrinum]SIS60668.1 hypothetical protein SAMN05421779_102766 [Insolitispirillum peregrinum]
MPSDDIVFLARETRRHAEAFHDVVRRFGQEMPEHLDRFHEAMVAFRSTAAKLKASQDCPPGEFLSPGDRRSQITPTGSTGQQDQASAQRTRAELVAP